LNANQTYYINLLDQYYIPFNQAISDEEVATAGLSAATDGIKE
jgi:hypothetical protein